MMYYWIISFCAVNACFFHPLISEEQKSLEERINSLNQQTEILQKKLKTTRLEEMKNEVESDRYFRTEWGTYIHKVEEAEKNEQEIEALKQQLKDLEEQREKIRQKMGV